MFNLRFVLSFFALLTLSLSLQARELPVLPHCEDPDKLPEQAVDTARQSVQYPCGVLVNFWPTASDSEVDEVIGQHRAKNRITLKDNLRAVAVGNASIYRALRDDPLVLSIIPDRVVRAFPKPDRPGKPGNGGGGGGSSSSQTLPEGVVRVNAPAVHSLGEKGSGVAIAIVDTGIASDTGDLNLETSCFDAFLSEGDALACQDGHGHGTHVAGTSAALDNSTGVIGVAPAAKVVAVRVLNNSGSGNDSTVIAGLQWIADNAASLGIDVVNMSLGREGSVDDNPAYRAAVTALADDGITVVVAAGNDQYLEAWQNVPASYPDVITVASSTAVDGINQGCRRSSAVIQADTASYFTTDGAPNDVTGITGVAISAPGETQENIKKNCTIRGVGILSLAPGPGNTASKSGTSMAAPHVAGAVALLYGAGKVNDWQSAKAVIQGAGDGVFSKPYDSPTSSYSFDGVREGILDLCGAGAFSCP